MATSETATAAAATAAMAPTVLTFESFQDRQLHAFLFKNVKNAAALRQSVISGSNPREISLINASMVVSKFHLHLAAYKTLEAEATGKLTTKTLHAELVFNLAGTTHVGESLKRCGVSDDTKHLLVALFDATPGDDELVMKLVEGEAVPLEQLPEVHQPDIIKKAFKLTKEELGIGSLEDGVVAKMASKGC